MIKRELATNGMWVVYEGSVGIMEFAAADRNEERAMRDAGICCVSVVDENGVNKFILRGVRVAELRQATFDEIPAARRPSIAVGKMLGYL